ncbi:DUF1592 domain-containing protein [Chondromyces apiculatus]|uniref:Cellulose-binding domain protein n=1 Tax=Chondromyces apiculatus DSM 436 TaxID=1192034 RepID=A0A017TFR4_9BACT|nr:DUF1592 domain-containing protein [Chondromyces apiculatus]EYF07456.1 Cellulose-binding domain protein [Chondromyces apiculatus DSM 436]
MEGSQRRAQDRGGRRFPATAFAALLVAGVCGGACEDAPAPVDSACGALSPGGAPIRRMTRFEYNNTVRDLLGDDTQPARAFVPEEEVLGYNNQAAALGVTQSLAEQYMKAAERLAEQAVVDLDTLMPGCDAEGEDALSCVDGFVRGFGRRAFRRPLDAGEVARFTELFGWGREAYDAPTGIALVIQGMLQSPHFLYRVELGMPDPVEKDVVQLSHYEIASRLSYLLWSSMPDEALFDAAEAGQLGTPGEIRAMAERMLEDPRARPAVLEFHRQWLELKHVDLMTKDPGTYPAYEEGLRPLWLAETEAFVEHVVFDDPAGDLTTLLTAPYSFLNEDLAAFYGVPGPEGEAFTRVDLDPAQRAGVLTHASVLATQAKPNQSSPIHRGKFVRERLLCDLVPPPPANLPIVVPEVQPGVSTRERFAQHRESLTCAGCHELMDPIGYTFEHYDGIGQWRDMDQGQPVDATGEVKRTHANGSFDGAIELAHHLAENEQVRQCVVSQWFRYGYGRAEKEEDHCSMVSLQQAFAESGYNIKALLVELTQTDAFRYRRQGGTP